MRYYFKYIVPNIVEENYNDFNDARHRSKMLKEKFYLAIYSHENTFNEAYDEEEVNKNSNIKEVKKSLIKSFNKLTNNN